MQIEDVEAMVVGVLTGWHILLPVKSAGTWVVSSFDARRMASQIARRVIEMEKNARPAV